MKLFGEFLVEKQYVTSEQLVKSLVLQVKMSEPVVEIVFKSQLLDSGKILSILRYQNEKRVEFVTASKELGLWTDELENLVTRETSKTRPPIGQVLLREGYIESKKLIEALDEYMLLRLESGDKEHVSAVEKGEAPLVADGMSLDELFDYFTNEKLIEFETDLFSIELERENFSEKIEEILSPFMTLKGFYEVMEMHSSKELVNYICEGLNLLTEKKTSLKEQSIWEFKAFSKSIIDLLWRVRGVLADGQTEIQAFEEEGNSRTKKSIVSDWESFKTNLES